MTANRSFRLLLCVLAALSLIACHRDHLGPGENFAIEGPPGKYVTVVKGMSTEIPAEYLKPLHAQRPLPTVLDTLKIDYRYDQDKVTATVYALTAPHGDPHRYDDAHKRLLGVHSARLHQTIELKELAKLGYEPIRYNVVSATIPPSAYPHAISKVPSIAVVVTAADRGGRALELRNSSDRDVLAHAWSDSRNSASTQVFQFSYNGGRPVIAAHGTHVDRSVGPQSPRILAAAVFRDGIHEGDTAIAAVMYASLAGGEAQRRRISPTIRRIIADQALDDDARIARIRSQLLLLPKTPDARMIRAMRAVFPDLPTEFARQDLSRGLDEGLRGIWGSLDAFDRQTAVYPPPKSRPPLAQWWPDEQ